MGVLAVLVIASFSAFAEHEGELRRVLVIDKSMKPAAAAGQAKYEYVRAKTAEGKPNPELMCDACCKKHAGKEYGTASGLQGKTVAYMCASCDHLCYRENGVEVKYTEETEMKAMKVIEMELAKPIDKTQKPSIQALQGAGR